MIAVLMRPRLLDVFRTPNGKSGVQYAPFGSALASLTGGRFGNGRKVRCFAQAGGQRKGHYVSEVRNAADAPPSTMRVTPVM